MIKFVYEIGSNEKYVFWYSEDGRASVRYPNGTTSEASRIQDVRMFGDWVDSIVGAILPPKTLSLFQYVFNKGMNGSKDFNIQAAYLVSNCMSDTEREAFKKKAIELDNEYFAKTGLRINLDSMQLIYAARHRMDAHLLLEQLKQALTLT